MTYRMTAFTFRGGLEPTSITVTLRAQATLERGDRTKSSEVGAKGNQCLRDLRPHPGQHRLCTKEPHCAGNLEQRLSHLRVDHRNARDVEEDLAGVVVLHVLEYNLQHLLGPARINGAHKGHSQRVVPDRDNWYRELRDGCVELLLNPKACLELHRLGRLSRERALRLCRALPHAPLQRRVRRLKSPGCLAEGRTCRARRSHREPLPRDQERGQRDRHEDDPAEGCAPSGPEASSRTV